MYVSSASCKSTGSGQFCTHQGVALLGDLALLPVSSLVPRPSPNFPSLAVWLNRTASDGKLGNRTASDGKLGNRTASDGKLGNRTTSDGKLGEGLGMRLTSVFYIRTTCTIMIFIACEGSAWHILPASYVYPGDALLNL